MRTSPLAVIVVVGCTATEEAWDDGARYPDGTVEAEYVVDYANLSNINGLVRLASLDLDLVLDLVAARSGPDEIDHTADDTPFETLDDLVQVGIGVDAFHRILQVMAPAIAWGADRERPTYAGHGEAAYAGDRAGILYFFATEDPTTPELTHLQLELRDMDDIVGRGHVLTSIPTTEDFTTVLEVAGEPVGRIGGHIDVVHDIVSWWPGGTYVDTWGHFRGGGTWRLASGESGTWQVPAEFPGPAPWDVRVDAWEW